MRLFSDYYTRGVSTLLFPLHERFKSHSTVAVRRHLEHSQWWDRRQLEVLRLERLRQLLTKAGRHVPYYRDLFREWNFQPEQVAALEDIQVLPFLTKDLIRNHISRLKADNASGLARFNTGGSSGQPLIFYIGKERVSHDVAAKWRATRWWGVDIGDPEIVLWGSPIELGTQDRLRGLRDRLLRTHLLPAFEMSPAKLEGFVTFLRRYRPRMLFGYPSALSLLARHASARGILLNDLGVKVAFVTAERLYDDQRQVIERVFGCPVANGYGGRDAGFIAHQCPAGGMHLTAEDLIVEIVGTDGQVLPAGEAGEVVVTHLATRDFPFIRYRTGDVAILDGELCSCGRGLPLLREVQGRSTDFVVAVDGTIMHGLALIYVVRDLPGIQAFKIIQESLDRVRVLLVPGGGFDPISITERIRRGFRERLGQGVEVVVEPVVEIRPERSGKHRYVISRVTVS